jgi:hypothetical protein
MRPTVISQVALVVMDEVEEVVWVDGGVCHDSTMAL